ncbi:unnamed protein product [Cuscuta europaea]|uniref:Bifunctional inhibitor/plant lipid transfer protein/seed storage helical domain-containing protein n=1 Tax=Cuscuta europaea TaxID=41803 RepID=A0A9P1EJ62_CUSEU|nr:unnamed protein product [Cuscuta europaea]
MGSSKRLEIASAYLISMLLNVTLAVPLLSPTLYYHPRPLGPLKPTELQATSPAAKPPASKPPVPVPRSHPDPKPCPPAPVVPKPAAPPAKPKPRPPLPTPTISPPPMNSPPPPSPLTPPPPPKYCPIDTMKVGLCLDILGGLIHIHLGDPAINKCCPMLGGLVGMEAAVCMCSTMSMRMMNLTIFMPVALELIGMCGLYLPPGYACDLTSRTTNSSAPINT